MNPEYIPAIEQKLLALGALDVFRTPIVMKKGRMGITLSVLTTLELKAEVVTCILQWTTALGVRSYEIEKTELKRDFIEIELKGDLEGHRIQLKRGFLEGKVVKMKPEWEELNAIALKVNMSHAEVLQRIMRQVEEEHETR